MMVWIILFILLALSLWQLCRKPVVLHPFSKQNTVWLRGVMAVLIIACHTGFRYNESSVIYLFTAYGAPIVSMFLFLSGYGLVKQYILRGNSMLYGFMNRSMWKILPPLLVATTIWLAIDCNVQIISKLGGVIYNAMTGNMPLPYSWFMFALIAFYVAFYLVFRICRNINHAVALMLVVTLVFTVILRVVEWPVFWYLSLFGFNVGTIIGAYEEKVTKLLCEKPRSVILVVAVTFALLWIYNIRTGSLALMPLGLYVYVVCCGGIENRTLSFLGRYSFEIYLMHGICEPIVANLHLNCWLALVLGVGLSVSSAPLLHIATGKLVLAVRRK